jgi:hypothetical protein
MINFVSQSAYADLVIACFEVLLSLYAMEKSIQMEELFIQSYKLMWQVMSDVLSDLLVM